jgi:hypothetical protein
VSISRRLRFQILRRDNHACRYCGASAPDVMLEVDHVVPRALGGRDEPSNLVAACDDCNGGEGALPVDSPLVDDARTDTLRWMAARHRALAEFSAEISRVESGEIDFTVYWVDACKGKDGFITTLPESAGRIVRRFLAEGFDVGVLYSFLNEAIDSTYVDTELEPEERWSYIVRRIRDARVKVEMDTLALLGVDLISPPGDDEAGPGGR